jgi:hypothetical protein
MAQTIEDLEARLAALEARLAVLEAKVHPSNVCIYAGQEYSEGAVVKQADDNSLTCTDIFGNGHYTWK